MNDNTIAIIVRSCTSNDGFLVKLHAFNTFDDSQFRVLMDTLHLYAAQIEGERVVDRSVAGCLLALHDEFLNRLVVDNATPLHHSTTARIERAFQELQLLINRILRVL